MVEPSPPPKSGGATSAGARLANLRPASIASILRPSSAEDDGDGPYFDLEFSIRREDDEDEVSSLGSDDDGTIRPDVLIPPSSTKPQLASSLLRSATKLRVFMLRFKKSKSPRLDAGVLSSSKEQNGRFLVRFEVEEVSSRGTVVQSPALSSDEKKIHPKDVIHKYLSKIKPLYNRASKRDRLKSSGQVGAGADSGIKVVPKGLRKSRSASAAVPAVRSPPVTQQEDGIESAIAHCKRSFNAGKGSDLALARCRSDPGTERDVIN